MFKSARKQQFKSPDESGAEEVVLKTGDETSAANSEETSEPETRDWARSDDDDFDRDDEVDAAGGSSGFDAGDGWEKAIRARAASGQAALVLQPAATDLKSRIAAAVNSKIKLTLMQKGLVLVCVPLLVNLVFAFVLGAIAEESERAYIRESQSKDRKSVV